ncbi:hypothetical protein TWF481_006831 [Arthrobotrys musiformis]|uniref:Uncharacterized protein n=1 Tax=Arthrobotrys musiformis TaxID=47236 RepID=A0AAV9W9S0_9PEZI
MKITLCLLALLSAVSAAPNPAPNADPSSLLQKRCAAGTALNSWCVSACGYNCRAQYNSCRNLPPPSGCSEAYSRMLSYCTTCCNTASSDCTSCQNCGNSYPIPPPSA